MTNREACVLLTLLYAQYQRNYDIDEEYAEAVTMAISALATCKELNK